MILCISLQNMVNIEAVVLVFKKSIMKLWWYCFKFSDPLKLEELTEYLWLENKLGAGAAVIYIASQHYHIWFAHPSQHHSHPQNV